MFRLPVDDATELRLLEVRHAAAFYALVERERGRLSPWVRSPNDLDGVPATEAKLAANMQLFVTGRAIPAGIWHEGALVGQLILFNVHPVDLTGELGYWIAGEVEGRGIVTRACRALLAAAFAELGLQRVEIRCRPENARSRGIPERLGFQREGLLRGVQRHEGRSYDAEVWGLTAADWAAGPYFAS